MLDYNVVLVYYNFLWNAENADTKYRIFFMIKSAISVF